jgi:hypothetical protein
MGGCGRRTTSEPCFAHYGSGSRPRPSGSGRVELADQPGVSEEHLKRIEQGRRPSSNVVDALASAMRLSVVQHEHLRTLAGFAAPGRGVGLVPREVTPAARRMIDRLDLPACVCDATWSVLDGNEPWMAHECPAASAGGRDRNMAWRVFTGAPTAVFRTAEHLAAVRATMVTGLRVAIHRYPADPELRSLIADLYARGGEFARLWDNPSDPVEELDRLSVPDGAGGQLDFDKDVLTLSPGDLRVVVFTQP